MLQLLANKESSLSYVAGSCDELKVCVVQNVVHYIGQFSSNNRSSLASVESTMGSSLSLRYLSNSGFLKTYRPALTATRLISFRATSSWRVRTEMPK